MPSHEEELTTLRTMLMEQQHYILRAQDREIGLEQQLATALAGGSREPLLIELARIKSSVSYRLGRTLTAPFRALGELFHFGARASRWLARKARTRMSERR